MYCKKCASYVSENAKFCANCGLQDPAPYWQKNYTERPQPQAPFQSQSQPQINYQPRPQAQVKAKAQNLADVVKKEKKTIMVIIAIIAVILIIATALNGSNLRGTWDCEDGSCSITFSDSKNGYILNHGIVYSSSERLLNFTYHTKGNKLELKTETTLFTNASVLSYEFEISRNELKLKDTDTGETVIFYKADS